MAIRERVRFKIYDRKQLEMLLDPNNNFNMRKAYKGCKYRALSAFSSECYTDLLSKVNRDKLYRMMRTDFPLFQYVEGVGFKTIHRDGLPVYVIAGEFAKQVIQPDRETVLLRRFNPDTFDTWTKRTWNSSTQEYEDLPIEKQVQTYMRNNAGQVKPVFKDRLTKDELGKLSMLYLLDNNSYIPGIGGMYVKHKWDYITKKSVPDCPVYFLER